MSQDLANSTANLAARVENMERASQEKLEAKFQEAVAEGDTTKVNQIRMKQAVQAAGPEPIERADPMAQWNADNPWITDGSASSNELIAKFREYTSDQAAGGPVTDAIIEAGVGYVEGILAGGGARPTAPQARAPRASGGKLTDASLTSADQQDWKNMQEAGFSMTKERFREIKAEEKRS